MQTNLDKAQKVQNQSNAADGKAAQPQSSPASQIQDNRPEAIQMRKLQEVANDHSNRNSSQFVDNRPEAVAQRKLQAVMNNSPQNQQLSQLQKMVNGDPSRQSGPIQRVSTNTGLPDDLKTGVENLSGYAMDDVKVHYNSDKPAQLQAHAYAQGTDIHIASGQEKHLPHEAWHVVQQKQGRVTPTMQMMGEVNINDDVKLEKEADVMGAEALKKSGESTR